MRLWWLLGVLAGFFLAMFISYSLMLDIIPATVVAFICVFTGLGVGQMLDERMKR